MNIGLDYWQEEHDPLSARPDSPLRPDDDAAGG